MYTVSMKHCHFIKVHHTCSSVRINPFVFKQLNVARSGKEKSEPDSYPDWESHQSAACNLCRRTPASHPTESSSLWLPWRQPARSQVADLHILIRNNAPETFKSETVNKKMIGKWFLQSPHLKNKEKNLYRCYLFAACQCAPTEYRPWKGAPCWESQPCPVHTAHGPGCVDWTPTLPPDWTLWWPTGPMPPLDTLSIVLDLWTQNNHDGRSVLVVD